MPRSRARRGLLFLAALGALALLKHALVGHFLLNVTPSIPRGVYWIAFGTDARRGDLVTFPIPPDVRDLLYERRYVARSIRLLAKPVAAVGGDHVCIHDAELVINGRVFALVL